jgi:aldose 1-epimerase
VANRINKGKFTLDGKTHQVDLNAGGKHHLHGGRNGFSHRFWDCKPVPDGVQFMLTSRDGDQWYPGAVDVKVTYLLVQNDRKGANVWDLRVKMEGDLVGDKATPINLTNHAAFNLEGHNTQEQLNYHSLQMDCDAFTPVDEELIPTKKVQYFGKDGPDYLDFRVERKLGR